jgi:protein TonB
LITGSVGMRMDAPGMASYTAPFDAVSTQTRPRLFIACAVSFLLHVTLIVGIPVNPTGGVPKTVSMINARLETAAPLPADDAPETLAREPAAEGMSPVSAEPAAAAVVGDRQKSSSAPTETRPESSRAMEPASSPSAGIEVPFIRDPTYYPPKQLDVYPQPLTQIRLDYPDSAAHARVDGRLTVLVLIDEFGIVNDVSVVEAKPEGYFEEAAMATFRGARFSPAQKQGHPVKSRVTLQVKYLYGESVSAAR